MAPQVPPEDYEAGGSHSYRATGPNLNPTFLVLLITLRVGRERRPTRLFKMTVEEVLAEFSEPAENVSFGHPGPSPHPLLRVQ